MDSDANMCLSRGLEILCNTLIKGICLTSYIGPIRVWAMGGALPPRHRGAGCCPVRVGGWINGCEVQAGGSPVHQGVGH